jgi:hypothetical protein
MRTDEEVRKRKAVLHETLAELYGKGMPYAEERLAARIDEDDWFLNEKPAEKPKRFKECVRCEHMPDDANCIHCVDLSGFVCEADETTEAPQ